MSTVFGSGRVICGPLAVALLLLWGSTSARGELHPLQPADTSSPRRTLHSFLEAVNAVYQYIVDQGGSRADKGPNTRMAKDRILDCLDLSQIPAFQRDERGRRSAVLLKEILDRIALPPDDEIPDLPEEPEAEGSEPPLLPERWRIPRTEIAIVKMKEGPRVGEYLFSSETIEEIEDFYDRVKHLPYIAEDASPHFYDWYLSEPGSQLLAGLVRRLPRWTHERVGGQAIWQWTGVFLSLVAALLVMFSAYRAGRYQVCSTARFSLLRYCLTLAFPIAAMLVPLIVSDFVGDRLAVSGTVLAVIDFSMNVVFLVALMIVVVGVGNRIAEVIIASPKISPRGLDAQLIRLTCKVLSMAVAICLFLEGGQYLGIPLTTLLAGAGVSGLAVALAAQDTLKNLFGSIMIILDRPYRVGERIIAKGYDGVVEEIGLRSTKLRLLTGHAASIPNDEMARSDVENVGRRPHIRRVTDIHVPLNTPWEKLRQAADTIRKLLDNHEGMAPQFPPESPSTISIVTPSTSASFAGTRHRNTGTSGTSASGSTWISVVPLMSSVFNSTCPPGLPMWTWRDAVLLISRLPSVPTKRGRANPDDPNVSGGVCGKELPFQISSLRLRSSIRMCRFITALVILVSAPTLSSVGTAAEALLVADFRQNPLPKDWQVEGYAFGSRTPGKERQQAAKTTANQRQYQFGRLTSPEFVIERGYLDVELRGTYHPTKCCVALLIEGHDVRRVSPGQSRDGWASIDVREFAGRTARLQARDEHFNGWVELGRIVQTHQPRSKPQKKIPTWEPAVFETKIDATFLLLPLATDRAPLEAVTITIDGQQKLVADMPLAMSDTDDYQPIYDLTGYQGKTLRVLYHRTAESRTEQLIRISDEIPRHEAGDRKPAFHIHCRFGRLNDPNGLVYHEGQYHLFHQYYYGLRAKHWAHYVGTDLVHWQEWPIALFPDASGSMHSGSAAVDWHNSGGFQKGSTPAIIAAFTGSRGMGGPDKIQVQGIAYSSDGGRTFTKYQGNPVLGLEHLTTLKTNDSRDPKIFWYSPSLSKDPNAPDGHWVMVLFEDGAHSLFTSKDLKQWEKQSSIQGFHECPELFPLPVDGDLQNVRWIMYGGNGEYHIGSFDGKTYRPETPAKLRFNHGRRYYAAQTFNDTPGTPPRRIQVGWQADQISFPIELSLRTTPLGLRLCSLPVREIEELYTNTTSLDGRRLRETDANPLGQLHNGLYDIDLDAEVKKAKRIELIVRSKVIRYDVATSRLSCGKRSVVLPSADGKLRLRVVVDNCSIDIHAGAAGLFYMPLYLGPLPSKALKLSVEGGPITLERLRVHQLRSIWTRGLGH